MEHAADKNRPEWKRVEKLNELRALLKEYCMSPLIKKLRPTN
jgi:hypothetical protein